MKVSLNWVKEYADIDVSTQELVRLIGSRLGEVEEVIDLASVYKEVVIARVVECEKHPDADKLSVCKVDDGGKTDVERSDDGLITVVCGAPNVRKDLLVAWLPPGSTVPASASDEEPFVLGARELRGIKSNGMIASANELGISDDHDGILEIQQITKQTLKKDAKNVSFVEALTNHDVQDEYKPGDSFAAAFGLDDTIIDIENKMFTHRPDCFGILGVAREIAGITGTKFTSPSWYHADFASDGPEDDLLKIDIENKEMVPRFTARVIQDVQVGPSPLRIQTRLMAVGLRPINNVVDITNYYMYLTAQPLHAYDYDKVASKSNGEKPVLIAKPSGSKDKLALLNGKEVALDTTATVIATNKKPVGVGGIMGGATTEVDNDTKNIILECANFDMYDIRRTSMHYGLFTDAGTRFNKGQSTSQNLAALNVATGSLICDASGMPTDYVYDTGLETQAISVSVDIEFINSRLGSSFSVQEISSTLSNVEFSVEVSSETLQIGVPFWRTDIAIAEDIVEEVGRLTGYDNLELALPLRSTKPVEQDAVYLAKAKIRSILASAGANEILSYSFIHGDHLRRAGQDKSLSFGIKNALSPDLQYYRQSITPSILDRVYPNIRDGYSTFGLFEIGKFHTKHHAADGEDGLPKEFESLAMVFASAETDKGAGFYSARAYLDVLAKKLGFNLEYSMVPEGVDYPITKPFDLSRSALVTVESSGEFIGIVGEYNEDVEIAYKLPATSAGFELDLEAVAAVTAKDSYAASSKYPSSDQDITLTSPNSVSYSQLFKLVKSSLSSTEYNWSVAPIGIYRANEDVRNISFRLTLSHTDKTLTTDEVSAVVAAIAQTAKDMLSVEQV